MPKKKPGDAAGLEASAKTLNPRGLPYVLGDLMFPPGDWVPVTAEQAEFLQRYGWAKVRDAAPAPEPAPTEEKA